MKRRERLHDYFALHVATAGPARDLGKQLKGPLAGAKIRLVQAEVGVNNPDQCHVRKMETLGDHLRAHEDIDFAGAKVAEDAAVIFFAFQGV